MTTRTLIVQLLQENYNSEGNLGFVKPIFEIIDDKLIELNSVNFCQTMKVFITGDYSSLQKSYSADQYFKLTVTDNERPNESVDPLFACRYVANARQAEPIKPKDYFDIIEAKLPDCNIREVTLNGAMPGTPYIFIDNAKNLYGPFKWSRVGQSSNAIKLSFVDSVLPNVALSAYQIYEIDRAGASSKIFSVKDGRQSRRLIQGLSIVNGEGFYDYASDEEVIRYAGKLASDCDVKLIEKSKINSYAALIGKNRAANTEFNKKRLARLLQISTAAATREDDVISGLSSFLKGENGKIIVKEFVDKNKDQYLGVFKKERESEIIAQLEDKKNEIFIAEARLKTLGESKVELSGQVEELKRAVKQPVLIDKAYADADKNLQLKKQELMDLEKTIEEKTPLVKGFQSLLDLEARIVTSKDNLVKAKQREDNQKIDLYETNLAVRKSEEELRRKLMGLKPFVDAINGAYSPDLNIEKQVVVAVHSMKSSESLLVRQKEVIGEMGRRLAEKNRYMPSWQVANLLISTQQSFITFLAGMPGVGKTSLARLLADIQEISPKRLTEVAVGRGWTAQKDLIGFYNPLTSRFQPSNTGLYSFFTALSDENDSKSAAMAYVLLDEANLSPIEHYWSTFMGMSDGGRNELQLGDKAVRIPDHLRFVATINYDSTTEQLSPRVVDRAPIILIENDDFDSSNVEQVINSLPTAFPLSASVMDELFGKSKLEPELQSDELEAFELIRNVLRNNDPMHGLPIQISRRKINAIQQYCAKASGIMNIDSGLIALDLAIVQHVLPQVRGTGSAFAKRLALLLRELENKSMGLSAKRVKAMIINGADNVHNYDFFCW